MPVHEQTQKSSVYKHSAVKHYDVRLNHAPTQVSMDIVATHTTIEPPPKIDDNDDTCCLMLGDRCLVRGACCLVGGPFSRGSATVAVAMNPATSLLQLEVSQPLSHRI